MKRKVYLLAACISIFPATASATLYELTYFSDNYGALGSFTIDNNDILNNEGNNPLGGRYVLNDYIQSLNFSYNGMTWGTDDIAIGPTTAHQYTFIDEVPTSPSGNGSLAANDLGQRITTFHPSIGIRFGSEFITGHWQTELASVPLPASAWLFLSGLASLLTLRIKKS